MVLNVHRNRKAYWDGEIGVGVGVEGGHGGGGREILQFGCVA